MFISFSHCSYSCDRAFSRLRTNKISIAKQWSQLHLL